MIIVTVFQKLSLVAGQSPIAQLLEGIKNAAFSPSVDPLRKMVREGRTAEYAKAKKKLAAFTPSGRFEGGRKMEYLVEYTGLVVLDIDKLSEDALKKAKALVAACVYTFACFVSPSGYGLKVLVRVSTGVDRHKETFLGLQKFYSVLTGVEIDPSGKDVTRLCFVSVDPELYLNEDALVYTPVTTPDEEELTDEDDEPPSPVPAPSPEGPKPAPVHDHSTDPLKILNTYKRCITYTEQLFPFVEGHRNEFVFTLALKLRKAGLAQATTEMLIGQDYNYEDREVMTTIKSVYSYNWLMDNEPQPPFPVPGWTADPPVQTGFSFKNEIHQNRINPQTSQDLTPQAVAENPPAANADEAPKKKQRREKYNLRKVEHLLDNWYETRYNVVTGVVEWRHASTTEPYIRLEDKHEHSMFRNLHLAGQLIPINTLHVILTSDFTPDFNPFTFYRDHLAKWDRVTDYIGQLAATVMTTDDQYWAFCFRKWFVAYAASLVEDRIINHTVIVLTGAQGIGKTSWMKSLIPHDLKDYLGTAILQTDSKDTSIQLAECALILLDELENLNRRDLTSFKEMITRPGIRIRRPYGRNSDNLPRRASFIASVNYEQILTDMSGSRRYLCSSVTALNFLHTIDMNCAMAQAYALFESGFEFWFDQDEIRELTEHNEDYLSKSIEEELVETWFRPVTRDEWDHRSTYMGGFNIQLMTATQIAARLTEKAKIILIDNTIVKIGKIMKKLGFERIRKGNSYSYMLRMLDQDTIDRGSRTLDISPADNPGLIPSDPVTRPGDDPDPNEVVDELPF